MFGVARIWEEKMKKVLQGKKYFEERWFYGAKS